MGEISAPARHALWDIAAPGRHGRNDGRAGVLASLVWPVAIAQVTARRGAGEACRERLARLVGLGVDALGLRRMACGHGLDIAWTGPDRWLVLTEADEVLEERLAEALRGLAAVVDQSDGRFLLRLRGGAVRACLAKGVAIDLHPRVFRPLDTAPVWLSHLAAQLSRREDGESYDLIGPRAAAGDLWHWLVASAGEFGLDLDAPP